MSVKIPSAKEVPAPRELITRGGALKLVGYLDLQLSVWGKVRGFFGKESYQYDKIVATAKDMVKNLEKKEPDYFSKGNLGLPIDIEFMTLLFKMLENYVKEGTNKNRTLLIGNKILTKKRETIRLLNEQERAFAAAAEKAKKSKEKDSSKSSSSSNNDKAGDEERERKETMKREAVKAATDVLSDVNKMVKSAVPGTQECDEILSKAQKELDTLNEFIEKNNIDFSTVAEQTLIKDKRKAHEDALLREQIKREREDTIKRMNEISAQKTAMVLEVQEMLRTAKPGSQECNGILEIAKNRFKEITKFINSNPGVLFPKSTLKSDIEKLEKEHKAALQKAEKEKKDETKEQKGKSGKTSSNETSSKSKVEKPSSAKPSAPNKSQLWLDKNGTQVVVEHKGGLKFVQSNPNKATVSEIINYGKYSDLNSRLKILNGSDLLGGERNTGNYQLFEVGEKKMNESWSKVAPTVNAWTGKIKAMNRKDMFKYILESYDEGKWK